MYQTFNNYLRLNESKGHAITIIFASYLSHAANGVLFGPAN